MLQLQYLNKKLKKTHIDQILSNYNIKYTTMKNEIDDKINIMIKSFTQDISPYLNNIKEIVEQKDKLKLLEYNQNEIESIREELKEKIHELTKLKREIELLKLENKRLKNMSNNYRKKRFFSPSFREKTMPSFTKPSTNKIQKKLKENKTWLLKTEHKVNKSKRFKSPINSELRKSMKKISDLILEDKDKSIKIKLKKDNKNSLSTSLNTELKTETNIINNLKNNSSQSNKDQIFVNKKKILNKKDYLGKSYLSEKNKSNISQKLIKNKLTNKSSRNDLASDKKKATRTMTNSQIKNKNNAKNNEDNSEDQNSISIISKLSSDTDQEKNKIDNEINEMNDIENEILSIIKEINEFKENSNMLT